MERITLPNCESRRLFQVPALSLTVCYVTDGAEAAGMASFERVPHCTCCIDMQDLPEVSDSPAEAATLVAPKTIV
jgi:hypothetical protein